MASFLPFSAAPLARTNSLQLDSDRYEKDMVNVGDGGEAPPGFGKAYTVEIDRGETMQKLGMCMYDGFAELSGIVTEVEPDSLAAGTVIQKFDRLVALNGRSSYDLDRMFKVLKKTRQLKLLVKRPRAYAIKVAKGQGLGVSFGYASPSDQFLLLAKIHRGGAIDNLNAAYKDREIRRFDAIVSVNGISGTCDNLLAEIEASDQITLGMMRWFCNEELQELGLKQ